MQSDVIHARHRARVRQDHNASAPFRIVAGEGTVSTGAAVVPDDFTTVASEDMPAEPDLEARGAGRPSGFEHRRHGRSKRRFRVSEMGREKGKHIVCGGAKGPGA